jgi:hypothetical protein
MKSTELQAVEGHTNLVLQYIAQKSSKSQDPGKQGH